MQRKLVAITSICALVLSGCGLYGNKEFSFFGEHRVNIAGANQMLDPNIETFDDEHLIAILNPSEPKLISGEPLTVIDVERAFQQANNFTPQDAMQNGMQQKKRANLLRKKQQRLQQRWKKRRMNNHWRNLLQVRSVKLRLRMIPMQRKVV